MLRALALLAALAVPAGLAAAAPAPRAPLTVVVVDPGHDLRANAATEPIGPGSSTRKVMDGGGAVGTRTGIREAVVVLDVSLRLRALLRAAGVEVRLTRTATSRVSMGNVARARIANRAGAALFVRVHADGSPDASVHGTSTLVPAYRRGWTDDVHARSGRAGRLLQAELVRALRSADRGVVERSDITGFNWSDVPVALPELGFLTNPREERLLASAAYRQRAAVGLCRGILRFLARAPAACG